MNNKFGLGDPVLKEIQAVLFASLANKKSSSVFVFGSRAIGKFRKYSDLDLWIEAEPELSAAELSLLKEKFDESEIPIKIDIVTPGTCLEEYQPRIQIEKVFWFSR